MKQVIMTDLSNYHFRKLRSDENIPYSLLLLADETIDAIDKYIHNSDIIILEQETEIIAVCATEMVAKQVMEIKNIAVKEQFQNKGIGFSFLKYIINMAKEQKCSEVIICTPDVAHKQLYLYQKAGFSIYKIVPDYYPLHYPNLIIENGEILKNMVVLKKSL